MGIDKLCDAKKLIFFGGCCSERPEPLSLDLLKNSSSYKTYFSKQYESSIMTTKICVGFSTLEIAGIVAGIALFVFAASALIQFFPNFAAADDGAAAAAALAMLGPVLSVTCTYFLIRTVWEGCLSSPKKKKILKNDTELNKLCEEALNNERNKARDILQAKQDDLKKANMIESEQRQKENDFLASFNQ